VEIKLKWIPQKQMTHENTYRDDIGFGAKMVSFNYDHLDLKGFNCRYNQRMDYAFCLLTLKSSEKW
jgi:hypothetical protein